MCFEVRQLFANKRKGCWGPSSSDSCTMFGSYVSKLVGGGVQSEYHTNSSYFSSHNVPV